MKIFISWSGEVSHEVAKALRDWLPSVIQSVIPYVSSEDIDKGARWSSDIATELDKSSFGILCITPDNIDAPWLNFEAGALGKSVEKSRVCPFLFKIKSSDMKGPILQYQSTIHDRGDVLKLIKAINEACEENRLEETRLERAFEVWWPKLDEELNKIVVSGEKGEDSEDQTEGDKSYISRVLEEILEISRTNQKLLRDPSTLLPYEYLLSILGARHGKESEALFPSEVKFDSLKVDNVLRHLAHKHSECIYVINSTTNSWSSGDHNNQPEVLLDDFLRRMIPRLKETTIALMMLVEALQRKEVFYHLREDIPFVVDFPETD